MHSWGDDWPHWAALYKAQEYFADLYERCTGLRPRTKEKWGTLRYEAVYRWIENEEHARLFRECIMRTIKKYPSVAGEVCSDAAHIINDDYFNGWCSGITFQTTGSYWSSDKRPKGV